MQVDHATEYITREKWCQALSIYKEPNSSSSYAKGRRKHLRFRMVGWAALALQSADQQAAQTVCSGCEVLDVSEEGLALRVPRAIDSDTVVSVELHVSGRIFWLSGRVVYHSRLPGAVRIGIRLDFGPTDKQTRSAGR